MTISVSRSRYALLVEELARRNVELAAIDAIGRFAARSPELRDFLEEAARIVEETTGCAAQAVYTADEAGRSLCLLHQRGCPAELLPRVQSFLNEPPAIFVSSPFSADVVSADLYSSRPSGVLAATGSRHLARIPLVIGSRTVGVLVVTFREPVMAAAESHLQFLRAVGAIVGAVISSDNLLGSLRRRVADLTLLNDLTVASAQLDPGLLLVRALRRIADALGCEMGAAFLREQDHLVNVLAFGIRPEAIAAAQTIPFGSGPCGTAVERREVVTYSDPAEAGGRFAQNMRGEGIRAVAGVPLLTKDGPVGAFVLGRRTEAPFGEEERQLLLTLGAQLGVAVENSRLYAEAKRDIDHLESVHALALRVFVHPPGDVGALLGDGCREIARALGAPTAVAFLISEDGQSMRGRAIHGMALDPTRITFPLEADRLASLAVREGVASQTPDTSEDVGCVMYGNPRAPPMALLAVPLGSRAHAGGAIFVGDRAGRVFAEGEVALARAMASALAVGVENAGLQADLGRSNAELERAQEQLLHRERLAALGALAAAVAHEVRNPLAVIFNAVGMLRLHPNVDEEGQGLIDMVGEEAERLNRIVTDLLGFARPAVPEFRSAHLGPIVEEAVKAALAGSHAPIETSYELSSELPAFAVDAGLVRQAVINVALNAMQAMPRGGRLLVRTSSADGLATVEVADTGPGIPDALRERVFEPFFTTRTSGTGLGLAIVKHVVEVHGGGVEVAPAPGGGTRLSLRFPLVPPPTR